MLLNSNKSGNSLKNNNNNKYSINYQNNKNTENSF